MALALDLPETWFVERCRRAILTTRAINYERAPGRARPAPGQMRMGAHTDYGVLTILLADDVPGLQVFRDGAVARRRDATRIVRLQPRRHARALDERPLDVDAAPRRPTAAEREGPVRRRALARFLDCPPDLVVECIPTCVDRRATRAVRAGERRDRGCARRSWAAASRADARPRRGSPT